MKRKEKTWKQCYQAHERRMWVTGVVIPLVGTVVTIANNPKACYYIETAFASAKNKTKSAINNIRKKIKEKIK